MKYRLFFCFSILCLSSFFVISYPALALNGVYALMYEDGKRIEDNSVMSLDKSVNGNNCGQNCCFVSDLIFQVADPTSVLSRKEWERRKYLEMEGCEDRALKTADERERSLSEWRQAHSKLIETGTQEEIAKSLADFMVPRGYSSYAYPKDHCQIKEVYRDYLKSLKGDAKHILENFTHREEYRQLETLNEQAPLRFSSPPDGISWLESENLKSIQWVKMDIAQGTMELITDDMRKEMQKMLDQGSNYKEIMGRLCREDFIAGEVTPPPLPPTPDPEAAQMHQAAVDQVLVPMMAIGYFLIKILLIFH